MRDEDTLFSPEDLAQWGLHCFCLGAVRTPSRIVRLDGNGHLLHRARDGIEWQGFATESQIELLELYGLLTRERERIRTAFPVIGPTATLALRSKARSLAFRSFPELAVHVEALQSVLAARRWERSEQAVIFGYALDGLMWKIIGEAGLLPATSLTLDRPYWNGVFWALYPPRELPAGVNEICFDGFTLVMCWTDRTTVALKRLAASVDLAQSLQRMLNGESKVCAHDADHTRWNFTGRRGDARIPLIRADTSDELHLFSIRLAATAANALLESKLPPIEGLSDAGAIRVIFAHEFIWEIMDLLGENGLLTSAAVQNDDPPVDRLVLRVESAKQSQSLISPSSSPSQ